jgi:hypothetical protein
MGNVTRLLQNAAETDTRRSIGTVLLQPKEPTMAKPPEEPPHSDIDGVNQDARPGKPSEDHPNPGGAIEQERQNSVGRPEQTPPQR